MASVRSEWRVLNKSHQHPSNAFLEKQKLRYAELAYIEHILLLYKSRVKREVMTFLKGSQWTRVNLNSNKTNPCAGLCEVWQVPARLYPMQAQFQL